MIFRSQYEYAPSCITVFGGGVSRCPPSQPKITSYEVRDTIEIKIRDLSKADDVLEGVVTSGANEVGGLQFGIDDETAVKAATRKAAIEDAKKKAKILAHDLGIRLKRIVSFSESGDGVPIYPQIFRGAASADSVSAAPQVAPGEQEVRSQVTITYEFR